MDIKNILSSGTFPIGPEGLNVVSSESILSAMIELSDSCGSKVEFRNVISVGSDGSIVSSDSQHPKNLIINRIEKDEFQKMIGGKTISSDQLYFVKEDFLNAYGKRLISVDTPTEGMDAVNLNYLSSIANDISVSMSSNMQNIMSAFVKLIGRFGATINP